MQIGPSNYYYQGKPRDGSGVREVLRDLAMRTRRWGYRMPTELLRRKDFQDNHKRIYRVYWEEKRQVTAQREDTEEI
jgi:hypothetical protein